MNLKPYLTYIKSPRERRRTELFNMHIDGLYPRLNNLCLGYILEMIHTVEFDPSYLFSGNMQGLIRSVEFVTDSLKQVDILEDTTHYDSLTELHLTINTIDI